MLIGVALLDGFTLAETKAAQPLVPLAFLANTVRVCYYVGFATLLFSLSLYMQHVLGFSALETGFAFAPFGLTILVSATVLAPRLLRRFGLRTLNGGGLAITTIGYILLAMLTAHGTYAADVLPGVRLRHLPQLQDLGAPERLVDDSSAHDGASSGHGNGTWSYHCSSATAR